LPQLVERCADHSTRGELGQQLSYHGTENEYITEVTIFVVC